VTVQVGFLSLQPSSDPGELRRFLALAADAGVDHVAVGDHVSFWVGAGRDGLIDATAVAMAHPTLPVHVAVYLLALRHPVLVARQLSTFSELAPGRLVLGVGIGGEDRHEVAICSVDPASRGRRMDECLAILRRLLAGERVTHHGEFFDLDDALVLPAPDPPIPVMVGGRSEAAVRRAARLGDGWLGIWVSAARFAKVVATVEEVAEQAGRGGVAWRHGMQVWCGLGSSHEQARALLAPAMTAFYQLPFERFERYSPYGTPEDVATFLAPYVQAGCGSFNLIPCAADTATAVEGVARVKALLRSIHSGSPVTAQKEGCSSTWWQGIAR
jgi:alkanesulfonate monooxygenase SsuD/methylene tetrahydromethanopterin reductase-like flavin-dependent oxidoreductase (luciferase family)